MSERFYFQSKDLTISGEREHLIELMNLIDTAVSEGREPSNALTDLAFSIASQFDVDGLGNHHEIDDEYYTPSATAGDYSPSSPWLAPGMSVSDFI